jgi:hypothetical protein
LLLFSIDPCVALAALWLWRHMHCFTPRPQLLELLRAHKPVLLLQLMHATCCIRGICRRCPALLLLLLCFS